MTKKSVKDNKMGFCPKFFRSQKSGYLVRAPSPTPCHWHHHVIHVHRGILATYCCFLSFPSISTFIIEYLCVFVCILCRRIHPYREFPPDPAAVAIILQHEGREAVEEGERLAARGGKKLNKMLFNVMFRCFIFVTVIFLVVLSAWSRVNSH